MHASATRVSATVELLRRGRSGPTCSRRGRCARVRAGGRGGRSASRRRRRRRARRRPTKATRMAMAVMSSLCLAGTISTNRATVCFRLWNLMVGSASSCGISRPSRRSPPRAPSAAQPIALGYTQSAISQQIATLERIVGEQLVERPGGPRPVSLTEAGQLLLRHARLDRRPARGRAGRPATPCAPARRGRCGSAPSSRPARGSCRRSCAASRSSGRGSR